MLQASLATSTTNATHLPCLRWPSSWEAHWQERRTRSAPACAMTNRWAQMQFLRVQCMPSALVASRWCVLTHTVANTMPQRVTARVELRARSANWCFVIKSLRCEVSRPCTEVWETIQSPSVFPHEQKTTPLFAKEQGESQLHRTPCLYCTCPHRSGRRRTSGVHPSLGGHANDVRMWAADQYMDA